MSDAQDVRNLIYNIVHNLLMCDLPDIERDHLEAIRNHFDEKLMTTPDSLMGIVANIVLAVSELKVQTDDQSLIKSIDNINTLYSIYASCYKNTNFNVIKGARYLLNEIQIALNRFDPGLVVSMYLDYDEDEKAKLDQVLEMISKKDLLLAQISTQEDPKEDTMDNITTVKPNTLDPLTIKPSKLVKELDKYIIGQDEVKKSLAMHSIIHYRNVEAGSPIKKNGMLIIGESGTGKTYTVEVLANLLGKRLKVMDVSTLTKEGYVGTSVSDVLKDIVETMNVEQVAAKNIILFIDEFDKLGSGLDVVREVQAELLKLIEGKPIMLSSRRDDIQGELNTSDMLIVLGGAFTSTIEKKKTAGGKVKLGFGSDDPTSDDINGFVRHEDIIKAGIMREVVGRIGYIVQTNSLSRNDMKNIIIKAKGGIKDRYTDLFKLLGRKDKVTDEDVEAIINRSEELKLGARGLEAAASEIINKRLYY